MTENKERFLVLQIITLETKLNAVIEFLGNMEHFNQDEMGSLNSFVDNKITQEKEKIVKKVMTIVEKN